MELEDKKVNIGFNNLLTLYQHYKDYLLPVTVIVVSIIILFLIIIPQLQQYFISLGNLKVETDKLQVLKNNYNFLASLDDAKATENLKSLSSVLPADKDFAGMVNAISYIAAKTGVTVGDFSFSVGNLAGATGTGGTASSPSIKIDVSLTGNSQQVLQFINELYKTAPAAEVKSLNINGSSGDLTIFFYYKPFTSGRVDENSPIVPLSSSDLALMNNLASWNNTTNEEPSSLIPANFSTTQASGGASIIRSGSSPF